jgi:hypothetical protein
LTYTGDFSLERGRGLYIPVEPKMENFVEEKFSFLLTLDVAFYLNPDCKN